MRLASGIGLSSRQSSSRGRCTLLLLLGRKSYQMVYFAHMNEVFNKYRLVELTCGNQIMRWMGLWLKDQKLPNGKHRFSAQQVNALPTVVGVVVRILVIRPCHVSNERQTGARFYFRQLSCRRLSR